MGIDIVPPTPTPRINHNKGHKNPCKTYSDILETAGKYTSWHICNTYSTLMIGIFSGSWLVSSSGTIPTHPFASSFASVSDYSAWIAGQHGLVKTKDWGDCEWGWGGPGELQE